MKAGLIVLLLMTALRVSAQLNIDFLSQVYYGERASNICGYVDDAGNEYALVGLYGGVSIVDLQDPSAPVELFYVPGRSGIWRELRTWDHHAYVTNETGGGLQIIDLSDLPVSIDTSSYTGDSLQTAHTVFIDENGVCYLFGANIKNGGAVMLDLTGDPENPELLGYYEQHYIHDGYVHGDTLWAAEIFDGKVVVIDVSDKSDPVEHGEQTTPFSFTHNCMPTPDRKYIFTTDEQPGASVAAYNCEDITDFKLLDEFRSHPGTGTVPHNTYWLNNFLVTSYYRDGVTIVDAHKPGNLVETGYFDTSPFTPGSGFNGCWGVWPFLPSGTIIASDIEEGLFVLQPVYKQACYLEGTVIDGSGSNIFNAKIEIMGEDIFDSTNISGVFKTGTATEGLYDIRISNPGCLTKIYPDILLTEGNTFNLEVELECAISGIDVNEFRLSVYPQIFTSSFEIYYSFPAAGDNYYSLTDISGRMILNERLEGTNGILRITPFISPGIYFLTVTNDAERQTLQVIKI